MFYLYVTIFVETPEVMIFDCDMIRERSYLQIKQDFNSTLIVFVNCN